MPVIKSFAIEDFEQSKFNQENKNFLNKAIDHTKWNAKSFAVVNTITDIAPLLVIGTQVIRLFKEELTLEPWWLLSAILIDFIVRYDVLSTHRRLLTQSIASMDRVFELIDEKYDIEDKPDSIECRECRRDILCLIMLILPITMRMRRCLKNITFRCTKGRNDRFCWNEWWWEIFAY